MNPSQPDDSEYDAAYASLAPGWLIGNGRYTLVQQLGRGGMGVVWLAHDEQLRERVALKFLSPEIKHDSVALAALMRETARARKLSHPNIVRVYDFFKDGHEAFISMEFVDGPHLGAMRLDQPKEVFAWTKLEPLVRQLCEALDYAHGEGIIHRDIKPTNLMVNRKGLLKLTDFGFTVTMGDGTADLPSRFARSGTLEYISPAQLASEEATVADDIYSLGATLYELLTGLPPFPDGDIAHQIRNRLPPPIPERLAERNLQNEIPAPVSALIMACLAKDPAQRPQSMRLILEALRAEASPQLVTISPTPVESTSADKTLADVGAQGTADSTDVEKPSRPVIPQVLPEIQNWSESEPVAETARSRNVFWWAAGAMILLAGIAIAAWTVFSPPKESIDPDETESAEMDPSSDAKESGIVVAEPTQISNSPAAPLKQPPAPKATAAPVVQFQTADLIISGTGFTVAPFVESGRIFSDRKHVLHQVPLKFRGWSFTHRSFDTPPPVRLRAKRTTFVYIAASAPKPASAFPGWEAEGSSFYYSDAQHKVVYRQVLIFRKRLEAGQEIDLPNGGKFGSLLLLPITSR